MTLDAIKAELHHSPFRPFKLVLADGREVTVPHHDYLIFSPGGGTVFVYHAPEAYTAVDPFHVIAVIPLKRPRRTTS